MKKIIFLLIFTFVLISCKEEHENSDVKDSKVMANLTEDSYAPVMMANENSDNLSIEPQIIKTGRLRFPTNNLNESFSKITASLKKHKGSVEKDISGKDYEDSFYRTITIRIPNASFDTFVNDVSKGVNYFDVKEIASSDVTEQFIDLNARIKAKKTLEERYLQILNKASKVTEILEIEKQLAVIREEVEAKQAQLNYLQSQVSMSTISIEMYTEGASGNNATVSYGQKIWNAIVSGFNGISSFLIGLLHIWPFILILAVVFFLFRRRIKKNKKV